MAENPVFDVPGVFTCTWDPAARSVIGRWQAFRPGEVISVVTRHLTEAGALRADTVIVDVTAIKGVLSPEDGTWVATEGAALARRVGLRAIINVVPLTALTKMGADRWAKAALGEGLESYTCTSIADALHLATELSQGRVPVG